MALALLLSIFVAIFAAVFLPIIAGWHPSPSEAREARLKELRKYSIRLLDLR